MRIQVASDVHHETATGALAQPIAVDPSADVLVLAGDIDSGARAVQLYGDAAVPVIYVHGNHELGRKFYHECLEELRVAARGTAVIFLERDEFELEGVRFLGACLWTDFALHATREAEAIELARSAMFEYREHGPPRDRDISFKPEDACAIHRDTVRWIESRLRTSARKTVVVTHHAPSLRSIPPGFRQHLLVAAYASRLDNLVQLADLWIHGHVHRSMDYYIGNCRVVCNPRGRPGRNKSQPSITYENAKYDATLIVEV